MSYILLKWIHIVSSTILFGTGVGSAFFLLMANRSRDISAICFATRYVVIADWLFTTPAVIIQPLTGMLLIWMEGYSYTDGWILLALLLYIFAGACWLPVVWVQIKMRDMAQAVRQGKTELPTLYWELNRCWIALGSLAFPTVLIIFYLMASKPHIAVF